MHPSRLLTTLALAVACGLGVPAAAQDAPAVPEASAAIEGPEARGVSQALMAAELAAWGRAHASPEALRLAARILEEVPLRAGEAGDADVEPVLSPAVYRREAMALEGGPVAAPADAPAIAARPGQSTPPAAADPSGRRQARPPAAAVPPPAPPPPPPPPAYGVRVSPFGAGPVSTVKRLGSHESWSFEVQARGAEVLRVAVVGDGDADVGLIVRDARGKPLCTGAAGGHYPACTLSPATPARLRIDVINRGGIWTRVQVLTN